MPLDTYISTYKGGVHITQGNHSNFNGFVSTWCSNIPQGVFPGFNQSLQKELIDKAYKENFLEISNVKKTWKKTLLIGKSEFTVIAVQTG
jgi:hypothetical protein